jgi:Radical SAM superfamily
MLAGKYEEDMKVGVIAVFTDYLRRGAHHRGLLQPQIGPLIAALLPDSADIHVLNDTWENPDWDREYDLLFLSCLHSDFDRARQISHYWRRRGAKTVLGGIFASTYPQMCAPYFDAVAIGDPETTVPDIYTDFCRNRLRPRYVAKAYDPKATPTPRFDLVKGKQVLPVAIEATRGCPFVCEFCSLTGLGTRYQVRPPHSVIRDILAGRRTLGRFAAWHKRNIAVFYDNNLGGSFRHLHDLCDALAPLGIYWGVCVSFNALRDEQVLKSLSRAGCRGLFVGLESFNPAAISDMHKHQNLLDEVQGAIERCHEHGMLLLAGLMLNPRTDDLTYISGIGDKLRESGLHVPAYISFETPFPGTPHFHRLAREAGAAFMPNALLRDFNGYTLVTRPVHATPEAFAGAYRELMEKVFSSAARTRKFLLDSAGFLSRGQLMPLLYDLFELVSESPHIAPGRSLIAGTDLPPPEHGAVPLTHSDFVSDREREDLLAPTRVTDNRGHVLAHWLPSRQANALQPLSLAK